MKKEYDFSKAEKGKFYRPDASFSVPIYLDKKVSKFYSKVAEENKIMISELVNTVLMKEMEIIASLNCKK